jgi:alpha-galactosidase
MLTFKSNYTYKAVKNTLLNPLKIEELTGSKEYSAEKAWINIGGWQSWSPGFEIKPGQKQENLTCHIVRPFNKYLTFHNTSFKTSKNIVLGHFVIYLRWDNFYLFLASSGNLKKVLPPVQFIINRKENTITPELCDTGKIWEKDEVQCELEIFTAQSFFEARKKLEEIFGSSDKNSSNYSDRFNQIDFLGKTSLGWESWYNHYTKIDEKLIEDDLEALSKQESFINIIRENENPVFQIDDGWEKQLGNWEIDEKRFPKGLQTLTEKISAKGYIPGLWIAPFIIDLRSPTAINHPDWLLRNKKGHLISAGYNPLWGPTATFYALDISNEEVLSYLDEIMEKLINEWGFRYLKLDFLYAGMIYGNFKNKGPSYQWYSAAIKMLTKRKANTKGEKVTYLGCGAPFEMSFNDLPLSRIGCDTYEKWENKLPKALDINGRNSAYLNLKDTLGHAIWDKIIFANDPDVIFIRKENCYLTSDEKLLIATVNILFGSQIMYSDDPASLTSQEEIELSQKIKAIRQKYQNEQFLIKNTDKDKYYIESLSKKYSGEINLGGKDHYIIINEA